MTGGNNGQKTGRDASGRFAEGNPGRPRGARHKATQAALALLDGEAEALTRRAVELALEGDTTALRLCLERIAPPRKDAPIQFDLPPMETAADAAKAAASKPPDNKPFQEDGVMFKPVNEAKFKKIENELLEEVRLTENNRLIRDGMSKEWLYKPGELTPKAINTGLCDVWAGRFKSRFGGAVRMTDVGDGSAASGHYWVQIGKRYFDAESFKMGGVKELTELPFFKRAAKYRGEKITMGLIDPSKPFHLFDVDQKVPIPKLMKR